MISEQDIRQLIIHGTGAEGRAALQHFRSSSHIDILLVDQPEKLSEFRTDDGSSAKIQCISEDDVYDMVSILGESIQNTERKLGYI